MSQEGKAVQAEVQEISTRTDTLSYALLAEINTFHQQRVKDMKTAHQHFLQEQITFYQKVSCRLHMYIFRYCLDWQSCIAGCGEASRLLKDV